MKCWCARLPSLCLCQRQEAAALRASPASQAPPAPAGAAAPPCSLGLKRGNDTMRQRQIELLRHCAGLPAGSPPRKVPTLRIVNREYEAGR